MRDISLPRKGDSVKWKDPPFCFHESKKHLNNEDLTMVVLRQGEDQCRTQKILTQKMVTIENKSRNNNNHTHTQTGVGARLGM